MKRVFAALLVICLAAGLLAGCGAGNKTAKYIVLVVDGENAPVPGVLVEFCTDKLCTTATSDETGIAELEKEPGEYTVPILKVPEGFAPDESEYSLGRAGGLVTVTLKPQA